MTGAPGSGKTMIARRIPGILPEMTADEALDVTRIYSIAGLLGDGLGLVETRPFRAPHHSVSAAGLLGGGSGLARPGEAVLANHGVLFMDEMPLFRKDALEALRAPLEDGVVRIARGRGAVTFPCRLSLVAAMNPCPCGYADDWARSCSCSEKELRAYGARVSGPLLDRFDIHVEMARVSAGELLQTPNGESSAVIRSRVEAARELQRTRYGCATATNASVPRRQLREQGCFAPHAVEPLRPYVDNGSVTGRGVDRILRVARTIADLLAAPEVTAEHVSHALALRTQTSPVEVAA